MHGRGGVGVTLYSPGCGGCVSSPSLVFSFPRCWCHRCCSSLPLPLLSPRCRHIVAISPVVPSKRPPAPAIPPASSGLQWRGRVLGRRFVGVLVVLPSLPLAPAIPPASSRSQWGCWVIPASCWWSSPWSLPCRWTW